MDQRQNIVLQLFRKALSTRTLSMFNLQRKSDDSKHGIAALVTSTSVCSVHMPVKCMWFTSMEVIPNLKTEKPVKCSFMISGMLMCNGYVNVN